MVGFTVTEPLARLLVVHPRDVAVQEVALEDDQESREEPPKAIEVGLAESVTVGKSSVTVRIAEAGVVPPGPVQEIP